MVHKRDCGRGRGHSRRGRGGTQSPSRENKNITTTKKEVVEDIEDGGQIKNGMISQILNVILAIILVIFVGNVKIIWRIKITLWGARMKKKMELCNSFM